MRLPRPALLALALLAVAGCVQPTPAGAEVLLGWTASGTRGSFAPDARWTLEATLLPPAPLDVAGAPRLLERVAIHEVTAWDDIVRTDDAVHWNDPATRARHAIDSETVVAKGGAVVANEAARFRFDACPGRPGRLEAGARWSETCRGTWARDGGAPEPFSNSVDLEVVAWERVDVLGGLDAYKVTEGDTAVWLARLCGDWAKVRLVTPADHWSLDGYRCGPPLDRQP
ncbi:MAG: hypothetical protein QOD77_1934 [Thermoplasmata archaeon]|jgi:hypothetical protein|nr:hypothetical protein [Thermoplasmata archaeon]